MINILKRNIFLFCSKALKKTGSILHLFSKRIYGLYLKTLFKTQNENNYSSNVLWEKISGNNLSNEFGYKDETWNSIKFLNQLLMVEYYYKNQALPIIDNACTIDRVIFNKNNIKVQVDPVIKNRWVFMPYNKNVGDIFAFDGYFTIFSTFTELQFAFNYESITKRLRFMIVNNNTLVFEVVENGWFYRPVKSVPVSLEKGVKYHLRIEIIRDKFKFLINGKTILSIKAFYHSVKNDQKFILIFFDFGDIRKIDLEIDDLVMFQGKLLFD